MTQRKEIRLVGNEFTGYGHRKLTVEVYPGYERYSATTTDMMMTDAMMDDSTYNENKAVRRCIRYVCDQNNISYSHAKLIVL